MVCYCAPTIPAASGIAGVEVPGMEAGETTEQMLPEICSGCDPGEQTSLV